jgi:alanine racemase
VHIEVDTGMARQGTSIARLSKLLARLKPETGTGLFFEGLHTHYASAENHASDQNQRQTAKFCRAGLEARKADMWPRYLHGGNSSTLAANDGTVQRLHELALGLGAHLLVRPGLGLFGYLLPEKSRVEDESTKHAADLANELRPVLEWKTRVISLRDIVPGDSVGYGATWIATEKQKIALLPVGYADGYSRRHSRGNVTDQDKNTGGDVLVRGQRAPVVGRVSMDLTMVDVTNIEGVEIGDEVALLGRQGEEHISAEEMGRVRETFPYEVLCGVGARVKRVGVE